MPKAGYYAVAKGRVPGVYDSWGECEEQVKGFPGARYKKFKTWDEADEFLRLPSSPTSAPIASSSRAAYIGSDIMTQSGSSCSSKTTALPIKQDGNEDGYDVVYCDGACKGNGQPGSIAGVGVWWGDEDPRNIAERCPGAQTNNRAELIAIVRVLEETPVRDRPLMIKTDSTYSIKCLRDWHQTWSRNGWKTSSGKDVLNKEIIRYLLSLIHLRQLQGSVVKFVHVKGHVGIIGNEGADAQANLGAMGPELPERDWRVKRRQVKKLIYELLGAPEVVDKAVQVEITDDETLMKPEESTVIHVEDSSPTVNNSAPTESAPAPSKKVSEASVQTTEFEINEGDYSIDDLLDDDKLKAELAESL